MRLPPRSLALLLTTLSFAAIAACVSSDDGGGGGDNRVGNGDLSTGQYEVSNVDVTSDACVINLEGLDGDFLDVEVFDTDITIGLLEGVIEEGVFDVESSEIVDFSDDPFGTGERDCVIDIDSTISGFTTDEDAADAEYTFGIRSVEGSECEDAAADLDPELEFPCTSKSSFHLEAAPVPTPPLNPYEACYMFWDHYIDNPVTRGHRAYVAALVDDWTTGTLTLGTGPDDAVAILLYDITFGSGTVATYTSTNGAVSVTAPSNSLFAPVDVSISSAPTWSLTAGAGGNTTGGTGSASGFFNDGEDCFGFGDPEDCIAGSGDVTFMVGTTSMTIGESSTPGVGFSLGFCEDLSGFTGTFQERASQFARSHPALFGE